jgi:hypothetical protein
MNKGNAMKNLTQVIVSEPQYKKAHATSNYFRLGYEDALKNKPFNYSIENKSDSCRYERGRAFAVYCKVYKQPRAVWRNNVLAKTAQERLVLASQIGYII